jgi:hypothetical protein
MGDFFQGGEAMTPRQLEIIQHSLGVDQYGRTPKGFTPFTRNHFCAGPADEPDCRALIALGFMVQHRTTDIFPDFNCSVTVEGQDAMKKASPNPPKLTRSQMRYREYLEADGCLGETFREYLSNIQTDWYKREHA